MRADILPGSQLRPAGREVGPVLPDLRGYVSARQPGSVQPLWPRLSLVVALKNHESCCRSLGSTDSCCLIPAHSYLTQFKTVKNVYCFAGASRWSQTNSLKMLEQSFFMPTPLALFFPPSYLVDESGSGQPDGMDMVVCRAPGGEFYVEGETWNLDECTRCTCRKGRVLCDTEVCPPALCQAPIRNKDTCCYVCPGNPGQKMTKDAPGGVVNSATS